MNFEFLFNFEKELFKREISSFKRLLADDFIEFGSSGRIWDKKSLVLELKPAGNSISASDFKGTPLGPGLVLVTYRTTDALRSSIWKQIGSNWQMIFHQGTKY